MPHLDEGQLIELALGGAATTAAPDHVHECARCSAELTELRRVVAAGRAAPRAHELATPSPVLWQRVESAAFAGTMPAGAADPDTAVGHGRTAKQRRDPGRRTGLLAVAAAFVAGAVLAGTTAALLIGTEDSGTRQVAEAVLDPVGPGPTTGVASVVVRDGQRLLTVRLDGPSAGQGYREVWLLNPDTGALVSLGVLAGPETALAIPAGLRLSEFPAVDVSREPFDGNPAHSADSIVRGRLELTT